MRELFHRLFDDAALFPPGNAPMGAAIPAHRAHRRSAHAPCVGLFLVADARLAELAVMLDRDPAGEGDDAAMGVGVTVPGGPEGVGPAVDAALKHPAMELEAVEAAAAPGRAARAAAALEAELPPGVEAFVEISRQGEVRAELDALAGTGVRAKYRTGGLRAEAFPAEAELAAFVHAAAERAVPFKCTAGLHHAARHTDPETGFEHHGFLNVVLAADAAAQGAGVAEIARVLSVRDSGDLARRTREITGERARAVRGRFGSFGTCSIREPVEDLVALGLVHQSRPARRPTA